MDPATSLHLLRPNNPPFSESPPPSPHHPAPLSLALLSVEVGGQKQAQRQL